MKTILLHPKLSGLVAIAMLGLCAPAASHAQTLTSNLSNGYNVDNTNSGTAALQTIGGTTGGNVTQASGGRNQLLTFELPDLSGNPFDSADLELYYTDGGAADRAADLFVYNTLDANGIITSGQASTYAMPWDNNPTPSGWTLIQRSFVDGNSLPSAGSLVQLNSTGETNLTSFLSSNYSVGEFLVFGLVMDTTTASGTFGDGFTFATTGSNPNFALETSSTLSVVAVPEPTVSLLLLGAMPLMALFARRQRAKV